MKMQLNLEGEPTCPHTNLADSAEESWHHVDPHWPSYKGQGNKMRKGQFWPCKGSAFFLVSSIIKLTLQQCQVSWPFTWLSSDSANVLRADEAKIWQHEMKIEHFYDVVGLPYSLR